MTLQREQTRMSLRDEIAALFAAYIDAFTRYDVDAVCAAWAPVGLFPTPTGNFALDAPTFRGHCLKLFDFYRRQGVARA